MTAQLLLAALGHASPGAAVADAAALAATVAWLEDTKVRALPLDARAPLRDAAAGAAWEAAFAQYLAAVGCPVAPSARREAVTWLAGHAVGLEYADGAQRYAPPPADGDAAQGGSGDTAGADDTLTGVDDAALWAHVRSCAAALRGGGEGGADAGGGPCSEAAALAAATAQLAWLAALPPDERARAAAAAAAAADAPGSFPTGFAAPRPALARPAALLRACHVARLRALQSRADAALVAAQEATADPRTDTKLGRVGR